MKRFLSWIIVGLSVIGCPFVVYASYRLYLYLIELGTMHVPFIAKAITTLSEWLEEFEFIETGFSGLIATGIVLFFAWMCITVSTRLFPSAFGLRFFVFSWIGLFFALIAAVCLVIHIFSLHLSFLDTVRTVSGDVQIKMVFFTIFAELCLCALLERQCKVPFKVMVGGKARTLFCRIPDSADKPLKYLAYFSGKEGVFRKDHSFNPEKLDAYLRMMEEKYPELRDYLVFCGSAVSSDAVRCEAVFQVHGEMKNGKVEYYFNQETLLCSLFRQITKTAPLSLKNVPEIKMV